MVATSRIACRAAASRATALGWAPRIERARLAGAAVEQGSRLVTKMANLPEGVVLIAGGETTVVLPAAAGRGGRNQHLALGAALRLETLGRDAGITLLAAGTDGIDGATSDAGALVDAGTCVRGRDAGFDPHVSLAAADSGTFLEASGDLLHTGATLTNVGDLMLAAKPRGTANR
jgi:hydroxypyruvate reductase